jgi:menaquinone-dependent protoporphyrinogen IX oxidase
MEASMERRTFLAGTGAVLPLSATASTQFVPFPSKEKWAVVFGTWCGSARDAGMWISEGMGGIAAVFDARQKPDLKAYDHLVIGTAIHAGKGPKEFEDLIKANLDDVKAKVRAYYAVCGNQGDRPWVATQQQYIDSYLVKLCQATVPQNRIFPGRITKALLPESEIKMLEGFFKQQGVSFDDYDHLARWDCLQFGREILRSRSAPAKKS